MAGVVERLRSVPVPGMDFAVHSGQPEQPYSGSTGTYELFLDTEAYLLACPAHCDPAAVWPVTHR
jgi:hypothetical protein